MKSEFKELHDNMNARFDDMANRFNGLELKLTTKIDEAVRGLRGHIEDVDAHLGARIDGVEKQLTARIDGVENQLTARIDGVEKQLTARIDGVEKKLTVQIDGVDKKVDDLGRRVNVLKKSVESGRALPQG